MNISVIWILVFRVKRWNRSTVFLCNLVLADISWILTLPFLIYYHLNQLHWIFGDVLCKITRTVYHICYYCSIYFVTCLSMDRYLAIVHPLKSLQVLNKRQSLLICLSIWIVTSLVSVPVAYTASTQICPNNKTICSLYVFSSFTHISLPLSISCTVAGCLLPFIAICFCYCSSVNKLRKVGLHHFQKRDKLTKLMYSALIIFALLYFPYHLSRNTCIFLRALKPNDTGSIEMADTLFFVEIGVCSLNTCINPLFCFLAGGDFREQVCKIASSFSQSKTWRSQQQRTSVYPV